MKKLIPEDTVHAAGNAQETVEENTENLIPADTVHAARNAQETVEENTENLIPADTVDAAGNVWETVGENIRKGAKEINLDYIKTLVDIMFPVESVYIGESNFILKVGRWVLVKSLQHLPVFVTNDIYSGTKSKITVKGDFNTETETAVATVRVWKRVS